MSYTIRPKLLIAVAISHTNPRILEARLFPEWALTQATAEMEETHQDAWVLFGVIGVHDRLNIVDWMLARDGTSLPLTAESEEEMDTDQSTTFALYIRLDDDIFGAGEASYEVAQLLRDLAKRIEGHPHFHDGHSQAIISAHGNTVGHFHIKRTPPSGSPLLLVP